MAVQRRVSQQSVGMEPIQPENHIRPQPALEAELLFSGAAKPRKRINLLRNLGLSLMGITSLLGLNRAAAGEAHNHRDKELETIVAPAAQKKERLSYTLTENEKTRYNNVESWFPYLESLPANSFERAQGLARLQGYWNDLRTEAVAGNKGPRKILHALWVNRMIEEIRNPNPNMVRFDYKKYDTLVGQLNMAQITRQTFNRKIQENALVGLYCYYRDKGEDNELTQDTRRLFDPVMKLMENDSDNDIQQWGGYLMNQLFPTFTEAQQQQYLKRATSLFTKAAPGPEKLAAMRSINWLYASSYKLPIWQEFIPQVRQNLAKAEEAGQPKYEIIMLGLMQDPEATANFEKWAVSTSQPETQQAVAWSLGRIRSPKGLKLLNTMIESKAFNPLAREMAILSLAEYNKDYTDQVTRTLSSLSAKDSKLGEEAVPVTLREAAVAMQEKLHNKAATEADYYINKFLKTDADKKEFRSLRDQYVTGMEHLSLAQKNMVDRSLLPYRHFLQEIINRGGKHLINVGGVGETDSYKRYIGVRNDDGRITDLIQGMSSDWGGAITAAVRITPNGNNTFAHEFTHHVHQLILNNRAGFPDRIVELYKNAMKEKRVLDDYGATNEYEYLAQGGEAMDGLYKDHYYYFTSVFNRGYDTGSDNTRSKLKRQDPQLYDFLKSLHSISLEISLDLLKTYRQDLYAQLSADPKWAFRREDVA